jgi:hypothetical protein
MKRWAALVLACGACSSTGSHPAATPAQGPEAQGRSGRPQKEGAAPPPWVDKLPERGGGKIYGVGYSAPTFWPQDALKNAEEDARGKLALALASHVEVLGLDTLAGESATIDKEATDLLLRNSRIEATWVDANGARGEAGSVWALASYEAGAASAQQPGWDPGSARAQPSWLSRLPASSSKVYAVGYSGPTFKPEDARKYAGQKAVDNLAATLRAHVQAYTLLVENKSGLTLDQFSRTDDPEAAFLELVRQGAKVEAIWLDAESVRPGDPKGAVWALASIEVASTEGGMQEVQNPDTGPALDRHGNAPAEAPKP